MCRGDLADSSKHGHSIPLIKQCHICCLQYIAECYYSSTDECEKNWHGVCVALEPVTEMLMSFLMPLSPSTAASFDLYAVAAAFFNAGGSKETPVVFAQDLAVDEEFAAVVPPLSQGDGAGVGDTPTASVGGGGMSVGSQQLMSPLSAPFSLNRPASVSGGIGGVGIGTGSAAPAVVAPKRCTQLGLKSCAADFMFCFGNRAAMLSADFLLQAVEPF